MPSEAAAVRSCSELSPGDRVEAWRDGRLLHRGRGAGSSRAGSLDLFWLLMPYGTRQLLDLELLRVLRCPLRMSPGPPVGPTAT